MAFNAATVVYKTKEEGKKSHTHTMCQWHIFKESYHFSHSTSCSANLTSVSVCTCEYFSLTLLRFHIIIFSHKFAMKNNFPHVLLRQNIHPSIRDLIRWDRIFGWGNVIWNSEMSEWDLIHMKSTHSHKIKALSSDEKFRIQFKMHSKHSQFNYLKKQNSIL